MFRCNFGRKIPGLICFCFRLKLVNKVLFFSENVAVSLYPVSVVARAFEYIVAITFVVCIACGSDSHCVT